MNQRIRSAAVRGRSPVPASKSHTIRALLIAALAEGESTIRNPLDSRDTRSCIETIKAFGAEVEQTSPPAEPSAQKGVAQIRVRGVGTNTATSTAANGLKPASDVIDVGNSGTTLYLAMAIAAVSGHSYIFTGDAQTRRRSAAPLLKGLQDLGARAVSTPENGCAPFVIQGPLTGGRTDIPCPTSQYLSALLLAAPLATAPVAAPPRATPTATPGPLCIIEPEYLYEKPYVEMTLDWLDRQGITYTREGYARFEIIGGQSYKAFDYTVGGDYSSATFLAVAAAASGGSVTITGLRDDDRQGDRQVFDILQELGCSVSWTSDGVHVSGKPQKGGTVDMNAIPDALPALSVLGCVCPEPLHLRNAPQARSKETDRVAVMAEELGKLGAKVDMHEDGISIHPSQLSGGRVDSHDDHRVAMAMTVAGLIAGGEVEITNAECADVTFPGFYETIEGLT